MTKQVFKLSADTLGVIYEGRDIGRVRKTAKGWVATDNLGHRLGKPYPHKSEAIDAVMSSR